MYNREIIRQLVDYISARDGNTDKSRLQSATQETFSLVKERSVYYCEWFAIRFCKSASKNFSNTVLALSVLHRYDEIPFIVCLVTPTRNYLMLANTTFLRKISHSGPADRHELSGYCSGCHYSCRSVLRQCLCRNPSGIPAR